MFDIYCHLISSLKQLYNEHITLLLLLTAFVLKPKHFSHLSYLVGGGEACSDGQEVKSLTLEYIASKWQTWVLSPCNSSASLSL